jgi:hypothetical protein
VYLAAKDNRDSWGMCTTSVECKTILIVMLMIMSGMDPHMISWNPRWVWLSFGLRFVVVSFNRFWVGHSETP